MQVFAPFVLKRKYDMMRAMSAVLVVVTLIALLSQTVFAKNTYVITDGDQVQVYYTYATNPADVLNRAGVELAEGDLYVTEPGDGVSEITIQRSQSILINNCGEVVEAVSYGETVDALLNRLGITIPANCSVSVALESETFDGLEISIDRVLEVEETYTLDIPYETVINYDAQLPKGEQKVLTAGVNGQLSCVANVVYGDSVEISRTVLQETVIRQPVNEVIAVGTAAPAEKKAPIINDGVIITESGEVLKYYKKARFEATAYTKTDEGCDDITATGTYARVGAVAVDPKVIPYGTRMFIVSNDGAYIYGVATAEDCGGAINGDRLDLYMDTTEECFQFGRRSCTVYFLG